MIRIADIIAKRKRIWEEKHDLELDRELVRASVRKILSDINLVNEIRAKPYLLIEVAFYIVDKKKKSVPFFLNEVQRDFISKYEEWGTKKAYFILKGRQQGFTSLITAMQLSFAIVQKNFSGFTLADSGDNTRAIFNDKARTVYTRLPEELKPTEKFNSVNELFFDKLNSSWRIATATDQVGRSRTLNFVHFSEVAFYECSLANLQKGIGEAMTEDAFRVYETTANGFNEAKDLWDSNTCYNLFYEWWRTSEYRSNEYEYLETNDPWLLERIEVLKSKGLDKEQITWYCKKYDSYLDKNTIKQEYPITPEEAFISSGDCVFNKEALVNQIMRSQALQPLKKGYFTYKKIANPIKDSKGETVDIEWQIKDIEFEERVDGYITIHEEPRVKYDKDEKIIIAKCPYVLGGDTAGTGIDYFTGKMIDNTNGRTVATLRKQKIDEDLYGEQMLCLAKYYNDALIGIETNYSRHPIRVIQKYGYTNLYLRERVDEVSKKVERVYGFETTRKTKPIIIGELVELMRDPSIEVDTETLKEMTTFVKKDNGKMEAIEGAHDDLVMAKAIAHFVSSQQATQWIEEKPQDDDFITRNFASGENDNSNFMSWEDF